MRKKLFVMLLFCICLFADNNENKIKNVNLLYAPFIIVQENSYNKQIKFTFIESKYVKFDGSYCDVEKENIPEIKDKDIFSEKYCKKPLPSEKIIQTIKNENVAYPFDWETSSEKIVTLSKNYTSKEYDFYDSKGYTITNPSINSEHIYKMGKNKINIQISGIAQSNRGSCSGETSAIITLRINNNLVFDNLYTNNYCRQLISLRNIILDFTNNTLKLDLYLSDYEKSYFFDIPFSYFKNKRNKIEVYNTPRNLNKFF